MNAVKSDELKLRSTDRSWSRTAWGSASLSAALLAVVIFSGLTIPSSADGGGNDSRYRFGVGVQGSGIEQYDVERLRSGWHVDWIASDDPPQPAGMEYAQMVRLHQLTECWPERRRDRSLCPYVEPYTYTLTYPESPSEIVSIAEQNPGSLWFIGNEMDRRDWDGGGQDEMLPSLYAEAYHDLYYLIKGADPSAQVAIGGVVQPTPLRLEYLSTVWDTYYSLYLEEMPVEVWNVHNMILYEKAFWPSGADVPPGSDANIGATYGWDEADSIEYFKQHIIAFRQWMKDKGERNKPLIISEYSVLYGEDYGYDYPRVRDYLYQTLDYMRTKTDSSLGYPEDGDRLVQRWAWYSLNDDDFEGSQSYHHFFDPDTKEMTDLGRDYANYISDLCYESDVDCDCDVDVADIQSIADRWRCTSGESCYYPWYDLDADQQVTVVDIMRVAAGWNWGGCQ